MRGDKARIEDMRAAALRPLSGQLLEGANHVILSLRRIRPPVIARTEEAGFFVVPPQNDECGRWSVY
jgi:hypothetical protein